MSQNAVATWKASLRPAKETDIERVVAFYKANPDKNILARESAVGTACAQGRLFIVESDAAIVAVSAFFPVGQTLFAEVGGTRVANGWQGFGLQDVFFWMRFASVAASEPKTQISTAIDPANTKSMANAQAQGFVIWANPVLDLLSECDPAPGRDGCEKKATLAPGVACCSAFLLLPRTAQAAAIAKLLQETSKSNVLHLKRKSGETLELSLNSKLVTDADFREMLTDFIG